MKGVMTSQATFGVCESCQDHFCDDSSNCGDEFDDGEYPSSVDQLEQVRKAFTKMVCTQECPPKLIESPSFLRCIKFLNPVVELGKFESLKDECLKFYERDAIRIRHKLKTMEGKVNLSVETFRNKDFSDFLCLTAHLIDEKWKLTKWTLEFQILDTESLAGAIVKFLDHWGIRDKALTLSLKSFTFYDDVETVDLVKDYLQEKNQLQIGGKLFQVYCCAELLALMVQEALEGISEIINKLQYYIPWGIPLSPWQLANHSLKKALQLQAMGEIDVNPFFKEYLISVDEWEKVGAITKLIDKLHSVAEILFRAKRPSASLFLVNLHVLHVGLMEQDATESGSFVNSIRVKMLQKFEKYWENMLPILAVAAVMDPRCKMVYIEHLLSKTPQSSDVNNWLSSSAILEIVRALHDEYVSSTPQQENYSSDSSPSDLETGDFSSSEGEVLQVLCKRRKVDLPTCAKAESGEDSSINGNANISNHLQDYQEYVQLAQKDQPCRSELDLYLDEPVFAWKEEFKLLKWWQTERPKYPTLSRLARDLLSIPFSVATSDYAYYTEDREIDERLLSSDPTLMNALKCTRDWNRSS